MTGISKNIESEFMPIALANGSITAGVFYNGTWYNTEPYAQPIVAQPMMLQKETQQQVLQMAHLPQADQVQIMAEQPLQAVEYMQTSPPYIQHQVQQQQEQQLQHVPHMAPYKQLHVPKNYNYHPYNYQQQAFIQHPQLPQYPQLSQVSQLSELSELSQLSQLPQHPQAEPQDVASDVSSPDLQLPQFGCQAMQLGPGVPSPTEPATAQAPQAAVAYQTVMMPQVQQASPQHGQQPQVHYEHPYQLQQTYPRPVYPGSYQPQYSPTQQSQAVPLPHSYYTQLHHKHHIHNHRRHVQYYHPQPIYTHPIYSHPVYPQPIYTHPSQPLQLEQQLPQEQPAEFVPPNGAAPSEAQPKAGVAETVTSIQPHNHVVLPAMQSSSKSTRAPLLPTPGQSFVGPIAITLPGSGGPPRASNSLPKGQGNAIAFDSMQIDVSSDVDIHISRTEAKLVITMNKRNYIDQRKAEPTQKNVNIDQMTNQSTVNQINATQVNEENTKSSHGLQSELTGPMTADTTSMQTMNLARINSPLPGFQRSMEQTPPRAAKTFYQTAAAAPAAKPTTNDGSQEKNLLKEADVALQIGSHSTGGQVPMAQSSEPLNKPEPSTTKLVAQPTAAPQGQLANKSLATDDVPATNNTFVPSVNRQKSPQPSNNWTYFNNNPKVFVPTSKPATAASVEPSPWKVLTSSELDAINCTLIKPTDASKIILQAIESTPVQMPTDGPAPKANNYVLPIPIHQEGCNLAKNRPTHKSVQFNKYANAFELKSTTVYPALEPTISKPFTKSDKTESPVKALPPKERFHLVPEHRQMSRSPPAPAARSHPMAEPKKMTLAELVLSKQFVPRPIQPTTKSETATKSATALPSEPTGWKICTDSVTTSTEPTEKPARPSPPKVAIESTPIQMPTNMPAIGHAPITNNQFVAKPINQDNSKLAINKPAKKSVHFNKNVQVFDTRTNTSTFEPTNSKTFSKSFDLTESPTKAVASKVKLNLVAEQSQVKRPPPITLPITVPKKLTLAEVVASTRPSQPIQSPTKSGDKQRMVPPILEPWPKVSSTNRIGEKPLMSKAMANPAPIAKEKVVIESVVTARKPPEVNKVSQAPLMNPSFPLKSAPRLLKRPTETPTRALIDVPAVDPSTTSNGSGKAAHGQKVRDSLTKPSSHGTFTANVANNKADTNKADYAQAIKKAAGATGKSKKSDIDDLIQNAVPKDSEQIQPFGSKQEPKNKKQPNKLSKLERKAIKRQAREVEEAARLAVKGEKGWEGAGAADVECENDEKNANGSVRNAVAGDPDKVEVDCQKLDHVSDKRLRASIVRIITKMASL